MTDEVKVAIRRARREVFKDWIKEHPHKDVIVFGVMATIGTFIFGVAVGAGAYAYFDGVLPQIAGIGSVLGVTCILIGCWWLIVLQTIRGRERRY